MPFAYLAIVFTLVLIDLYELTFLFKSMHF